MVLIVIRLYKNPITRILFLNSLRLNSLERIINFLFIAWGSSYFILTCTFLFNSNIILHMYFWSHMYLLISVTLNPQLRRRSSNLNMIFCLFRLIAHIAVLLIHSKVILLILLFDIWLIFPFITYFNLWLWMTIWSDTSIPLISTIIHILVIHLLCHLMLLISYKIILLSSLYNRLSCITNGMASAVSSMLSLAYYSLINSTKLSLNRLSLYWCYTLI